jgi:hypothetical protein
VCRVRNILALTALSNLLVRLGRQAGQSGASEGLREQVLKGRRRLLGEDHPDTLSAMTDLAGTDSVSRRASDTRKIVLRGSRRRHSQTAKWMSESDARYWFRIGGLWSRTSEK